MNSNRVFSTKSLPNVVGMRAQMLPAVVGIESPDERDSMPPASQCAAACKSAHPIQYEEQFSRWRMRMDVRVRLHDFLPSSSGGADVCGAAGLLRLHGPWTGHSLPATWKIGLFRDFAAFC